MTIALYTNVECSPRTRGWSRVIELRTPFTLVLPAHAGMVPNRA